MGPAPAFPATILDRFLSSEYDTNHPEGSALVRVPLAKPTFIMENAPVTQPVQNIHIHMDTLSYFGVPVDVISIIATLLVGFAQVFVILRGFKQMRKSSEEHSKQLDKQHDVQKRQFDAQDRKTDMLIENLRIQGQALQNLLERMTPPAPERTPG